MRVAVLGYGSMGRRHAANATALGHDVRVWDPATVVGHVAAASEADAVGWAEAVVVASPAAHHGRQFWRAARAGLPVLVEKPLALSPADFWEHAGRAGASQMPATTAVGYNLRHHGGLRRLREVDLPRVGPPTSASLHLRCDRATWPGKAYGSTLLECSHEVDLALWLLGPAGVAGAESRRGGRAWRLVLRHAARAATTEVVVEDDRVGRYERGGSVTGPGGTVRWEWHAPSGAFAVQGGGDDWHFTSSSVVRVEQTYRDELEAFLRAAAAGAPARPDYRDGLEVLDVVRWATLADGDRP